MQFPSLYTVPEVMTKSRYSEEQVLQWGYIGEITFLVLVPEIGACRVPKVALSHLMTGADEYASDKLPEHYSGQLAGPWAIKRDRLRILAESWDRFSRDSLALVDAAFPDTEAIEALRKLPEPEAARWKAAAPVEGRSNRLVSFSCAGLTGTHWVTLEQFCEEVNARLTRWAGGNYEIIEAAQILADSNAGLVAEELCRQMEQAVHGGELVRRKNGIKVSPSKNFGERIWNSWVRQDDVNEWLKKERAGFQLTYPYEYKPSNATNYDYGPERSPEYQAEYLKAVQALDRLPLIEKEIREWENAHPDTVKDKQEKVRNLAELKKELAALQELVNPGQSELRPPVPADLPVVAVSSAKPRSNKSEKTLIFEAKVLEVMGKFWNDRTPGTEPTKSDLCKLVYDEILRTPIRGVRKTTRSMVNDAAKPWKMPIVLPAMVPDSKFNDKRHPFKGEK